MNIQVLKDFYTYHFTLNHHIWKTYIVPLADDIFFAERPYSVGSLRNHIVHLINVDNRWFSGLRNDPEPGWYDYNHFTDRTDIRELWDSVETRMREYLDRLSEDMLLTQPFLDEDFPATVAQMLLHVVNHGTDHRAQILQTLHSLGIETQPQDYMFFVLGRFSEK